LYELGNQSMGAFDIIAQSSQVCRELSSVSSATVHLVILKGERAVFVNKITSPYSMVTYSEIGKTAPAYCIASGKVLLAYLPPSDLDQVLEKIEFKAFTQYSITSKDELVDHLYVIRTQGYAEDTEEYERGVCCVSAPVRRFDGQVVAAVSVSQLVASKTEEKWQIIIQQVQQAAAKISKNLGYRGLEQGHEKMELEY
ncbi:MAG: IclR family transcriptional regulator, partial [Desulfitobacteriaceae bacterium]